MQSEEPLVSIVIVNFDEEQFIPSLITSLNKFEPSLSKEILILDNHSRTDLQELLGDKYPEVTIVKQETNDGFGRTSNRGMRIARGEYLLLLNPDMELKEDCISKCIDYFEKHPGENIGALACRIVSKDGFSQKSFILSAASILKALETNAIYRKLFARHIKRKSESRDDELHRKTGEVPWLCGAFLIAKRETVNREQFYFDEDFFLYSEDCELGYRMGRKNYCLIYLPETSIVHFGGGSMPSLTRFEQLTTSEWLCMMKIHGKFYFLSNQLLIFLNLVIDEFLFRVAVLRKGVTMYDLREKIIRRKLWALWKGFIFRILVRYHRMPSSSKTMLKYK